MANIYKIEDDWVLLGTVKLSQIGGSIKMTVKKKARLVPGSLATQYQLPNGWVMVVLLTKLL